MKATEILTKYLTKRIKQLKRDHARLDVEKAPETALLRLRNEENDLRHCIDAIKELEATEITHSEEISHLQHQVKVKDRRLQEAQVNVNLIMDSYSRASKNEDNMLKWIMERRVKKCTN